MHRKLDIRGSAFLFLPVLLLAGVALYFSKHRNPQTPQETELAVLEVQYQYIKASNRLDVDLYVNCADPAPAWWGKKIRAQWLQNFNLIAADGQRFPWKNYTLSVGPYDIGRQKYVLNCTGTLPKGFKYTQAGGLEGTVVFADQPRSIKPLGRGHFILAT